MTSLLILTMILPLITLNYGLLRLYQQILFILSLLMIEGILLLFKKNKVRIFVLLFFLIIYFLTYSNFLFEAIGGTKPDCNLNNEGDYYDLYYFHNSEIISINWIKQQKFLEIYSDKNKAKLDSFYQILV